MGLVEGAIESASSTLIWGEAGRSDARAWRSSHRAIEGVRESASYRPFEAIRHDCARHDVSHSRLPRLPPGDIAPLCAVMLPSALMAYGRPESRSPRQAAEFQLAVGDSAEARLIAG